MKDSLNRYGKYVMLRPTGFGKTYMSAMATNIRGIKSKKVIFVYVSEILRLTFDKYTKSYIGEDGVMHEPIISNGEGRIKYETYNSVALHWQDDTYLSELFNGVGLIIFDEVQRMGAVNTIKGIDNAMKFIKEHNIKYIGASATPERSTGIDVCSKYFTSRDNNGNTVYCWGEHIYTLSNAFEYGLLQMPLYKYIEENKSKLTMLRHTRASMLNELKISGENNKEEVIKDIKELERAVIKDCDKKLLDGIYELVGEENPYIQCETTKELPKKLNKPSKFPNYMRFLIFAPDRLSLSMNRQSEDKVFGGIIKETLKDFKSAFKRYGYKIRFIVVSSNSKEESDSVKLIDPTNDLIKVGSKIIHINSDEDTVIKEEPMTIDLIFSINMLNVGYHVNNITGIILKRWTGSNQIYYQQIGRCLSSVSSNRAIIFDFVNSVDSRGIMSPMFNTYEENKDKTVNADGTSNIEYHDIQRKSKNIIKNRYAVDANGDIVDPYNCNVLEAKYIKCSLTNADLDFLVSRVKVYEQREFSKKLFERAYNHYKSGFNKKASESISLNSSLIKAIRETNRINEYRDKEVTINFKDYLLWCMNNHKDLMMDAKLLNGYLIGMEHSIHFKGAENSILAACEGGCKLHIKGDIKECTKDSIEKRLNSKGISNIVFVD